MLPQATKQVLSTLGAVLCTFLFAPCLLAQVPRGGADTGLNVDMNRTSGSGAGVPASTYGAAAAQPGFWNNFVVGGAATISLSGLTGSPTGATLTRVTGGSVQSSCPSGVSADFSRLMCDYDFDVGGVVNPIEYRFDNLVPGFYTVITYAGRADNPFQFQIAIMVNNSTVGQDNIAGNIQANTFTLGVTHTQRNVTIGPGDSLRVIARDNSGDFGDSVSIGGIQLVSIGQPAAIIASPAAFSCVCPPVNIVGTASGAGFAGWFLEYSATGNDPWTLIASGANTVNNSTLATWNPNLPEDYYVLRLTVQNTLGQVSTAILPIYLNASMDSVVINSPMNNQVLGGVVCLDGTVWDRCGSTYTVEYRSLPSGVFAPIDPMNLTYPGQRINLPLGGNGWNTTALRQGPYEIRIIGTNTCGDRDFSDSVSIIIDDGPPVASISSPTSCTAVRGIVPIIGTARDDNIANWQVQFTGGPFHQWMTIGSGSSTMNNVLLVNWDTAGLPHCCYAVRVVVTDSATVDCSHPHQSEYVVLVEVGCRADFNQDNTVNSQDFFDFLQALFAGC